MTRLPAASSQCSAHFPIDWWTVSMTDGQPFAVAVLGTGALGCLFAARLARVVGTSSVVRSVTIAGTWAAALEAIDRDGIAVEEPSGRWWARLRAANYAGLGTGFDLVLVLGLSSQTPVLAPVAARARGPKGLILSLQNGMGHMATLMNAAGGGAVVGGITTAGATVLAPGVIRWGGADGCVIGAPSGKSIAPERLDAVCRVLGAAGFDAERTDDLDVARWSKLAINCAANPLTGLARVSNGALLATPTRRQATLAVAHEVARVGRGAGVRIDDAEIEARLFAALAASARNHSSMFQHLAGGRATEIDALCGAVVAVGGRLGVETPLNAWLCEAVREAERGRGLSAMLPKPTPLGLDEWVAMLLADGERGPVAS